LARNRNSDEACVGSLGVRLLEAYWSDNVILRTGTEQRWDNTMHFSSSFFSHGVVDRHMSESNRRAGTTDSL
jgi:hypothetical protein